MEATETQLSHAPIAPSIIDKIETLLNINRYEEAEAHCYQALAEEPEDVYIHCLLARTQLYLNKPKDSELTLKQAIQCDPDYPWTYYLLSKVNHELLKFTLELSYAEKAAQLDPEEVTFLIRLTEAQLQNGDIKQAKATIQQVIKLDPDSVVGLWLLGDVELQLANYSSSEKYYREALKFDPENIGLLSDLATSLSAQKNKLRESIDILFNIVQLDPTNKSISKNLYSVIQDWLDKNSFKGKGKQALSDLPEPLQYFYQDYKSRSSIFEAYGRFGWTFIWIGLFAAMFAVFSLLGV